MMLLQLKNEDGKAVNAFAATAAETSRINATQPDNITVEQHSIAPEVKALVKKYKMVFPDKVPDGLPPRRRVSHAIQLEAGAKPVAQRGRRLSWQQEQGCSAKLRTW